MSRSDQLSHVVGQTSVVQQVQTAIDAAFQDGRRMDSCLLLGVPGWANRRWRESSLKKWRPNFMKSWATIASPSDLNAVLLQAKDNSIVHIDESHLLKKEFQTALYLAIDQRKLI